SLDLFRLFSTVAQGHKIVGIADQHRTIGGGFNTTALTVEIPDSRCLLHPMQCDIQQQRTDNSALWRALFGWSEPTFVHHPGFEPVPDQSPRGKRPEV